MLQIYIVLSTALIISLVILVHFVVRGHERRGFVSLVFGIASRIMRSFSMFMRRYVDFKVPRNLPTVSNVEKLSEYAYRVLGQNPSSFTLHGTNTYLVTGGLSSKGAHILIDTGDDFSSKKYIPVLFDKVFTECGTKSLSKILLTHGHDDHQGGIDAILNELKRRNMVPLPTVHKRRVFQNGAEQLQLKSSARGECFHIENDQIFQVGNTTLQAIYSPGHTCDHVCFYMNTDKALISGDCVLGCGSCVFDDLSAYMKSLEMIKHIIETNKCKVPDKISVIPVNRRQMTIENIYPGHGPVILGNAMSKIEEYITHRNAQEQKIMQALTSFSPLSSWDLVPRVYGALPIVIHIAAHSNLRLNLIKLQKENRVKSSWPDLWSIVDGEIDGSSLR